MTNADVIALASAGLGDEIVIAKINAAPATAFDTSVDGLKALRAAGVSIEVVKTMISPNSLRVAVANATPPDPDDPKSAHPQGIYLMCDDAAGQNHMNRMRVVEPTRVGMLTPSGFLMLQKISAELPEPRASLQIVDANPKFYAYAGQDSATFEAAVKRLLLVKLDVVKTTRRLVIGEGRAETKPGVEEGVKQPLVISEVGDGILLLTPAKPLVPGEYALYEAGTWHQHSFQQEGGRFFDFSVAAKP